MNLASFIRDRAQIDPAARAVRGPDETLGYGALDARADQVSHALRELGVRAGDRVALWTEKSARGVAVMQGILRAGAVYVPIDPLGPLLRARRILEDCDVQCVFTSGRRAAALATGSAQMRFLTCDERAEASSFAPELEGRSWLSWDDVTRLPTTPLPTPRGGDDLAYILYTSGSTGAPKGVCISHHNASAFVDAMVAELGIEAADRLSNHAPFHFDLSVFDLYAAFRAGAGVAIVSEAAGYAPRQLVELLHREAITIWYSVPSALMLMMDRGGLCDGPPPPALRAVLFAGEVFPLKHLAALRRAFRAARLLNLYGPTETNVCTLHEAVVVEEGGEPLPIGRACSGDRVWARSDAGGEAPLGEVGELMVEGPTVMLGYWGQTPQGKVYATGDRVRQRDDGQYVYLGRRDQMVKVRGHRVELGEIEAALSAHPGIREVAVVAIGDALETRLVACVVAAGERAPGVLALKKHCAERLPPYMVVHELRVVDVLPRTSTGKIDRRSLALSYRATSTPEA